MFSCQKVVFRKGKKINIIVKSLSFSLHSEFKIYNLSKICFYKIDVHNVIPRYYNFTIGELKNYYT